MTPRPRSKLHGSVHTHRDPLAIEFHGICIGLRVKLGQCESTITGNQVRGIPHLGQHKVTKHRKEQPSTILINVNDIEMVTIIKLRPLKS